MTRSISPARPGGDALSEELGLEMLADSKEATSSTKALTCQPKHGLSAHVNERKFHAISEGAFSVMAFGHWAHRRMEKEKVCMLPGGSVC